MHSPLAGPVQCLHSFKHRDWRFTRQVLLTVFPRFPVSFGPCPPLDLSPPRNTSKSDGMREAAETATDVRHRPLPRKHRDWGSGGCVSSVILLPQCPWSAVSPPPPLHPTVTYIYVIGTRADPHSWHERGPNRELITSDWRDFLGSQRNLNHFPVSGPPRVHATFIATISREKCVHSHDNDAQSGRGFSAIRIRSSIVNFLARNV